MARLRVARMENDKYFISHNADPYSLRSQATVIHKGKLKQGQAVQTGQANLEEFDDEDSWKRRLAELGYEWDDEDGEEELLR